jgi:hypothetical protein
LLVAQVAPTVQALVQHAAAPAAPLQVPLVHVEEDAE